MTGKRKTVQCTPAPVPLAKNCSICKYADMKLNDYMQLKKMTDADMARLLDKDPTSVFRYRRGTVTPPLDVIAAIEKATDNAVSFRDFLPSPEAA